MSRTVAIGGYGVGSVVLDDNGNGTISVGPASPGEVWSPESTSITCTGEIPTTGTPTLFIYAGSGAADAAPGTFVDSTYNVTGAASSVISGQTLYPGQEVAAVWSGGPANGTATLVVSGTRTVP